MKIYARIDDYDENEITIYESKNLPGKVWIRCRYGHEYRDPVLSVDHAKKVIDSLQSFVNDHEAVPPQFLPDEFLSTCLECKENFRAKKENVFEIPQEEGDGDYFYVVCPRCGQSVPTLVRVVR